MSMTYKIDWRELYRNNALCNYKSPLDISNLIEVVSEFEHPLFYESLVDFIKQPFFLDSKIGKSFLDELQCLDEMRIRYEHDLKESENRINTIINDIRESINRTNG
jgi:hypothetical protein